MSSKILSFVFILSTFLIYSCQDQRGEQSLLFDDCRCEKIDFEKGIQLFDSTGQFSVRIPDSNWMASWKNEYKSPTSEIIMGDSVGDGISIVNISITNYEPPFFQEKEISAFKKMLFKKQNVEVVKESELILSEREFYYLIVKERHEKKNGVEQILSAYLTQFDPSNDRFLTINLLTSDSKNAKVRICELENAIFTTILE